jgi:hypothetical protein
MLAALFDVIRMLWIVYTSPERFYDVDYAPESFEVQTA